MSDGFVYFIQEEETGRIKIGFSEKHPNGRLKDFQTGNSNKLNLLGYIEGTYEDESNLHQEFSEERIREENEWFNPSPRLNDRIKKLLEVFLEEKKNRIEDLNQNYNEEGENVQRIYTSPSGIEYVGEWKDGKKHGQGTSTYTDGSKYVGEWRNGKRNGQGTLTFPDGARFVGKWRNGFSWNGMVYDNIGNIKRKKVSGENRWLEEEERDRHGNIMKITEEIMKKEEEKRDMYDNLIKTQERKREKEEEKEKEGEKGEKEKEGKKEREKKEEMKQRNKDGAVINPP